MPDGDHQRLLHYRLPGRVRGERAPDDLRDVLPHPPVHHDRNARGQVEHADGRGGGVDREPDPECAAGREDRLEAGPCGDGHAAVESVPAVVREDGLVVGAVGGSDQSGGAEAQGEDAGQCGEQLEVLLRGGGCVGLLVRIYLALYDYIHWNKGEEGAESFVFTFYVLD